MVRKYIALVGKTNSGKSTLLNLLTQQEVSIVSPQKGTTTDVVTKPMELIGYGPVVWVDTAGLDDHQTLLGKQRTERSRKAASTADLIVWVIDASDPEGATSTTTLFEQLNLAPRPTLRLFSCCDRAQEEQIDQLRRQHPQALFTSATQPSSVEAVKQAVAQHLTAQSSQEPSLVGDLLPPGSRLLLVAPIDSEAPHGRLILPQVQLLRDALDHHLTAAITQPQELAELLAHFCPHLVVTDSQLFGQVDAIVGSQTPLTSFSILLARQKGDLALYAQGARHIDRLAPSSRVLIAESCTHNTSHEDIARVKLPALLRKRVGKELSKDHVCGNDFPQDPTAYHLIIQCGGCMTTRTAQLARIDTARKEQIAITNFGTALAHLSGILNRSLQPFHLEG